MKQEETRRKGGALKTTFPTGAFGKNHVVKTARTLQTHTFLNWHTLKCVSLSAKSYDKETQSGREVWEYVHGRDLW